MPEKKSRVTEHDKHIGDNLQKLRLYKNMSQEQVGAILGVSFQQIQKYENGTNRLPAAKLYDLHQYFNVPLDYFFSTNPDKKSKKKLGIETDPSILHVIGRMKNIRNKTLKKKLIQIIDIMAS